MNDVIRAEIFGGGGGGGGRDPVVEPLTVTENGEYEAPAGVDGYNPVTVNVPEPATENLPYNVRLYILIHPSEPYVEVNWLWLDTNFAAGIMIRRNLGSYPQNATDGIHVATITGTTTVSCNDEAYDKDDPTQVGTISNPVKWYYRAFPFNSDDQMQTYYDEDERIGAITCNVFFVEQSTTIDTLPVETEIEFARYGNTALIWNICHKASDRVKLLMHHQQVPSSVFDAPEPTNPNSDRKNYGCNRGSISNLVQWLNKDEAGGEWFEAQSDYDVCNATLAARNAFMHDFTEAEKNVIIPETKVYLLPTVDGSGTETHLETVWLPAEVEMGDTGSSYAPEGTIFDMFSGENNTNAKRKENWETIYWLRTANVSSANYGRCVTAAGSFAHNNAYNTCAVRPGLSLPLSTLVVWDDVNLRYKVQAV